MRRILILVLAAATVFGLGVPPATAAETLEVEIVAVEGPFEASATCMPASNCHLSSWRGVVTGGDLSGAAVTGYWVFHGPFNNDLYTWDGAFEVDAGDGDVLRGDVGAAYSRLRDQAAIADAVSFGGGEGRFAGRTGSGKFLGSAAPQAVVDPGVAGLAVAPATLSGTFFVTLD